MPIIRNFLTAKKQNTENSHDGTGPVELYEIWGCEDFKSQIDFIDRVVIPPGSTVGYHKHGENEEMYIVLSGTAAMNIEGEDVIVSKGDMVLNPAHGAHGLQNNSDEDVDLLVVQVSVGN